MKCERVCNAIATAMLWSVVAFGFFVSFAMIAAPLIAGAVLAFNNVR